jgi:hypothetical protein
MRPAATSSKERLRERRAARCASAALRDERLGGLRAPLSRCVAIHFGQPRDEPEAQAIMQVDVSLAQRAEARLDVERKLLDGAGIDRGGRLDTLPRSSAVLRHPLIRACP